MLNDTLSAADEKKIHAPEQAWSNAFALRVARADFEVAENYRAQSHDARWILADQLYLGWEHQRYWEGTKVPRSSVGTFTLFTNTESLLPKIVSSIFADSPWFEVSPEPGTTGIDALRVRELMTRQMEQARRFKNQSIREIVRRALKDALIYGIGPVEIGWIEKKRTIRKIVREQVPVVQTIEHPQYGPIQQPTGEMEERLTEQLVEQVIQTPFLRQISAKDTYVDPNHTNPQFQGARFICTRGYMMIDELIALKDAEDFTIPPKERLIQLAQSKPNTQADQSKVSAESIRGGNWNPSINTSADPGSWQIEVITRWSEDRCVWLLNREEVAYNAENRYGFIPVFNAFYVDVPGRCYGLSLADVTEGEQRLQGAIKNARIDELSLHIHGRSVKKRGHAIPAHQMRRRPGQVIEADNPKEDVVFDQISPMLQQAFMEVSASEINVQKITGISDIAVLGVPGGGGGNSANRTATGVGAQVSAAGSRIAYLVENFEDTFLEPVLSAWHYLNTQFLDPTQALEIIGKDGVESIDPLTILNADVVFAMRASSKMQSREKLMQALPFLLQHLMQPQLFSQLQQIGQTFDMEELFHIVLDATGYKARARLIRPMNDQEKEAYAAAQQQEQDVELVKQRERFVSMKEMQDDKAMDDMQKAIVERGLETALQPPEPKAKPKAKAKK